MKSANPLWSHEALCALILFSARRIMPSSGTLGRFLLYFYYRITVKKLKHNDNFNSNKQYSNAYVYN